LNFASGAVPHQGVPASDFFLISISYFSLFEWCIGCRSTTRSRGTRWGTRLFIISLLIYFNSFELCIRCRSTTRSRSTRQATTLYFILFILIYLNCASGAAPQHRVAASDGAPDSLYFVQFILIYLNRVSNTTPQQRFAAPDRAPDFLFIYFIHFYLFELCIRCRSNNTGIPVRK
jgi:hypothetical protein